MSVLSAIQARYACKRFDTKRPVSDELRFSILEAGRLSPSSFGLEPWLFVIADDKKRKQELYSACFKQENLSTSDFVVSIAVRTEGFYEPSSDFIKQRSNRFPGGYPVFYDDYKPYWEYLKSESLLEHWARAQGYIASANMMTAAAELGVDSCPIEGYEEGKVLSILGLNPSDWRISILIPFGYRDEEIRPKIRESYESVVLKLAP
ncbi:NAD(P)H-dependent oxidoreductase [Treponema sp.]